MTDPLYRIKPLEWKRGGSYGLATSKSWTAAFPNMEVEVIEARDGTARVVGDGRASKHPSVEAAKSEVERLYRASLLRHLEPTEGNP